MACFNAINVILARPTMPCIHLVITNIYTLLLLKTAQGIVCLVYTATTYFEWRACASP